MAIHEGSDFCWVSKERGDGCEEFTRLMADRRIAASTRMAFFRAVTDMCKGNRPLEAICVRFDEHAQCHELDYRDGLHSQALRPWSGLAERANGMKPVILHVRGDFTGGAAQRAQAKGECIERHRMEFEE